MTILVVLFAGCAKERPKRPPEEISIPTRPAPSVPEALSPKREASQRIVQMGKEYLEAGNADKAVQTFQEAINVDPENGVAFFFMSLGLYQMHLFDDAMGILERAGALLNPYPDWRGEVEQLRARIEAEKEAAPATEPAGEGYY